MANKDNNNKNKPNKAASAGGGTGKRATSKRGAAGDDTDGERAAPKRMSNSDGEAMGVDAALHIADSVDDAALKKLKVEFDPESDSDHEDEQVDIGVKEAPDEFKINPENMFAGKKAIKSDFNVSSDISVSKTSSEAYADVTKEVLAENIRADAARIKAKAEIESQRTKEAVRARKRKEKEERAMAKSKMPKPRQAHGDYKSKGAVNDSIAQNEQYLRETHASQVKKRIIAATIVIIFLLFLIAFGISILINNTMGFTVNLTGKDNGKGLTLLDSYRLDENGNLILVGGTSKLSVDDIPNCDNVTYSAFKDLFKNVIDKGEGQQSRENYFFAYSFYVVNDSPGIIDYTMSVAMPATSKGVDDIVRFVFIEDVGSFYHPENPDRKITVAAKPKSDPVSGEWLRDNNNDYIMQKLLDHNGAEFAPDKQDNSVPFYAKELPVYREVAGFSNIEGKNVHKYTVIIYIEGGDPECTNERHGGGIKCKIDFAVTNYKVDK